MPEFSLSYGPPRFRGKVTVDANGCWRWSGSGDRKGYGRIQHRGKNVQAHRLAYEWFRGTIPEGLQIDHLCRVRDCVNPEHMEVVTSAENTRRGLTGAHQRAKTHCPHGHAFTPENTIIHSTNRGRQCRTCKRKDDRDAKRRKRARLAQQSLFADVPA